MLMDNELLARNWWGKVRSANPLETLDLDDLDARIASYRSNLDSECERAYLLAERARAKGLDLEPRVEIPRASDLAGRTEKLLSEHLKGIEVSDDIRKLLKEHDRETTSIQIAIDVAQRARDEGRQDHEAVEVGLRVGLAVLTEAVLVAPLEGVCEVRILRNADASPFLSVYFAGPIRAAGGTAQALAVLIADMIRTNLGISPYVPSRQEIERVKEEFGLYRGNLQYRPSPEEIESIVSSCPVMINGESTEEIEVSGQRDLPNVDDNRIRGGVLLVIGEGMCLKAPKLLAHTDRLNVKGWDFIRAFADRGAKEKDTGDKSRLRIKPIRNYMKEIIAGRPVFGDPSRAGALRLRYGRARGGGLAAAGINPITMAAFDDFLSVGTQMKIERPGKACAVTACTDAEGPLLLLRDGTACRPKNLSEWNSIRERVLKVWDAGELVLGYGEFLENNKELVPSGYDRHWWGIEVLEGLKDEKDVSALKKILDWHDDLIPQGVPGNDVTSGGLDAAIRVRKWHIYLRNLELEYSQALEISATFGTSLPPPFLPWWSDLPIGWIEPLIKALKNSEFRDNGDLCLLDAAAGWRPSTKVGQESEDGLWGEINEEGEERLKHGSVKAALLALGIEHRHEGNHIVFGEVWRAIALGLDLDASGQSITGGERIIQRVNDRIELLLEAQNEVNNAKIAKSDYLQKRNVARIRAEVEARQQEKTIAETERIGLAAANAVKDDSGLDYERIKHLEYLLEVDEVLRTLEIVRKSGRIRWEDAVPIRVGSRMGRPEKAAPRAMKPPIHALFPIGESSGNQRRLNAAMAAGTASIRGLCIRICTRCERETPLITCPHPDVSEPGNKCNGRTNPAMMRNPYSGEMKPKIANPMVLDMNAIVTDALNHVKGTNLPKIVKCIKGMMSELRSPEPLAKGILRAKNGVSVFRDGTIRYDMIDVPCTHARVREINTSVEKIRSLGYTFDIDGAPLRDENQIFEIMPQDIILSQDSIPYLTQTAAYVDELLVRFYDEKPFYNVKDADDLIGQLVVALAPHTSGGVLGRILGWTKARAAFAHPLFHAAKRRNCDGDEDCVMLLVDGLLNFSRQILPRRRGGLMDAPLVLTTRIDPDEIDKEALNVDAAWYYPSWFYRATLERLHPKEIQDKMDLIGTRLGTSGAEQGLGYTHETDCIDLGPRASAYTTLETMRDKLNAQLRLCTKLRGVDEQGVASSVVEDHFLPDLRGNLVAFSRQKVRCTRCGHSYRRVPLAGHCIQKRVVGSGLIRGDGAVDPQCRGPIALTVSEGAVRKYIETMRWVMQTYGVRTYTKQRVDQLVEAVDSLFCDDRVTITTLDDFF